MNLSAVHTMNANGQSFESLLLLSRLALFQRDRELERSVLS